MKIRKLVKPLNEAAIKNLLFHFKPENLERGYKAEQIVYEYLRMYFPKVVDFRVPEELTNWLTEASNKLKDYWGLHHFKKFLNTKFDFIVKKKNGRCFFVDAKSPKPQWLNWGLGAEKEQYDIYFRLSELMPFYIYAWVPEIKALYVHEVRNPKEKPKFEIIRSRAKKAYYIPDNEIKQIPKEKTRKVLEKIGSFDKKVKLY